MVSNRNVFICLLVVFLVVLVSAYRHHDWRHNGNRHKFEHGFRSHHDEFHENHYPMRERNWYHSRHKLRHFQERNPGHMKHHWHQLHYKAHRDNDWDSVYPDDGDYKPTPKPTPQQTPTNSTVQGGDVVCGNKTCPEGQTCCNESCGICAAPGDFCIAVFCTGNDAEQVFRK